MEKATKRIRFTLDLDQEDYDLLEGLGGTKAVVLRKGIRLLDQLSRREVFVHTPKGDRIPTEIILS